jgi:hypothetical protein
MPHRRQVMSAPTPEAMVLAMLIQRMEAPKWDGWMPGSLPGRGKRGNQRVGLVVLPVLFSVVM